MTGRGVEVIWRVTADPWIETSATDTVGSPVSGPTWVSGSAAPAQAASRKLNRPRIIALGKPNPPRLADKRWLLYRPAEHPPATLRGGPGGPRPQPYVPGTPANPATLSARPPPP